MKDSETYSYGKPQKRATLPAGATRKGTKKASLPAGVTRKVSAGPTSNQVGRTVRVSPKQTKPLVKSPLSKIAKVGSASKKNTRTMYGK